MPSQLIYVYIHHYRNIREQGFNLSSRYRINFTAKYEDRQYHHGILSLYKDEQTIPHLFDPCFTDVKGLVGENGSGKSTVMQFLAFHAHHHHDYMEYPKTAYFDIAVFEKQNPGEKPAFQVYYGTGWKQDQIRFLNFDIVGNIFSERIAEFDWSSLDAMEMDVLYYSNAFDNKDETDENQLNNISTNFLLRQDRRTMLKRPWNHPEPTVQESLAHTFEEARRRLNFSLNFKGRLPFKLPGELLVYFNTVVPIDLALRKEHLRVDTRKERKRIFDAYLVWMEKTDDKKGHERIPRAQLQKQYFNYLILYLLSDENDGTNERVRTYPAYRAHVMELIVDEFDQKNGIINLKKLLESIVALEIEIDNKLGITLGASRASVYLDQFMVLDEMLSPLYEGNHFFGTGFRLPFDNDTLEVFDQYRRTLLMTNYLNFDLPGLSSGEFAFLTLFSRFYALADPKSSPPYAMRNENLLILIDEGDVYFHPKWQVKFLSFLNELLPQIFTDKAIQLVLTSHSPFMASDLPPSHLLFLRKGGADDRLPISGESAAEKCILVEGPVYTFGANVHELLSDSFFLEGAHIGQLAKDVIYRVVDQLDSVNIAQPYTRQELLTIIRQVGEPWVRSRLIEKYESFYQNKDRQ